ncbi:MAG: amino acid permease [Candidatus Eremiobacteraeota bacterium]|nr:amino acid permease [Candidatus Eremiobacteraeota bacterium]
MVRGVGPRGALSVNIITMIGIGPLITLPLVLSYLHGPLALAGWIAGAIVALCDGLVWAALSSRYPGSGGTYVYLRESFGSERVGRLLAFLFNWQYIFFATLILASGYIGFANYAGYFFPVIASSPWVHHLVAVGVGLLTIVLLYRRVTLVSQISVGLSIAAILTLLIVIGAALPHANFGRAFRLSSSSSFGWGFVAGLGQALIVTLYDYAGYSGAALIGDEVRDPNRTIPRAILISIAIVAALYIALQIGALSVIPWQELVGKTPGAVPDSAQYFAATLVSKTWGTWAARIVTFLILITAFASLFGNLLGASRVPYAAARDGAFFKAFGRLHSSGQFPYVSLLVIGGLALPAALLTLREVITYLTTGIVLIQGIAQILALFHLRLHGELTPFKMWLFPVPALVALLGWAFAFYNAGSKAIVFGVGTLSLGLVAYLITARVQRAWPFMLKSTAVILALVVIATAGRSSAAQFGHSAIVARNGYPVFTVDGKPFFPYGASFFYERLPRSQWRSALLKYKELGINTIDVYLMWNWHELRDGDFDFSGRTSPRRDLHALFSTIHALGFKTILRPGPVIRNEWRNGGYPAWLLQRPEYNMPLQDILEGRYPATATLQNAHSDDAAAEWMHNATHMRYASRWLRRVLNEIAPWGDDVLTIALDDDQGAYIDNQTWPAPHLQDYLRTLAAMVRGVTGPAIPLFINTYQMKVTASAPVWAWGNWYQSDALQIGEHDRSQLEFSTGLLQTQADKPVMVSEFQAGWLAPPDDVRARQTDPANTSLALHTMLGMGAHGIVNFPVQDTLYPAGYEVPFANAFYTWEAAVTLQGTQSARFAPTEGFGQIVRSYGRLLADTHRVADAAIIWLTSAYDEHAQTNAQISDLAIRTIAAQQWCRAAELTCDLVDLRFSTADVLKRYPLLLAPATALTGLSSTARVALEQYQKNGGHVFTGGEFGSANPLESVTQADRLLGKAHAARSISGVSGATLLADDSAAKVHFLDVVNYAHTPLRARDVVLRDGNYQQTLPSLFVAPRSALLLPLGVSRGGSAAQTNFLALHRPRGQHNLIPVRSDAVLPTNRIKRYSRGAVAYAADVYEEGTPSIVMENENVRIIVAPAAGARGFVFEDKRNGTNAFTTVGALRDDVTLHNKPSNRDYIAQYTHAFSAGTFNRPYKTTILQSGKRAVVRFIYDAPDVLPAGARFERTLTLEPHFRYFTAEQHVAFHGDVGSAGAQRAVSTCSLALGSADDVKGSMLILTPQPRSFSPGASLQLTNGVFGLYDTRTHELATLTWMPHDIEKATVDVKKFSVVTHLTYARGGTGKTLYAYDRAANPPDALHKLQSMRRAAALRARTHL